MNNTRNLRLHWPINFLLEFGYFCRFNYYLVLCFFEHDLRTTRHFSHRRHQSWRWLLPWPCSGSLESEFVYQYFSIFEFARRPAGILTVNMFVINSKWDSDFVGLRCPCNFSFGESAGFLVIRRPFVEGMWLGQVATVHRGWQELVGLEAVVWMGCQVDLDIRNSAGLPEMLYFCWNLRFNILITASWSNCWILVGYLSCQGSCHSHHRQDHASLLPVGMRNSESLPPPETAASASRPLDHINQTLSLGEDRGHFLD